MDGWMHGWMHLVYVCGRALGHGANKFICGGCGYDDERLEEAVALV